MSFGWKWHGENKIYYWPHKLDYHIALVVRPVTFSMRPTLWSPTTENRFDNKMANRFFIKEDIAPPSVPSIDLQVAMAWVRFNELRSGTVLYLDLRTRDQYVCWPLKTTSWPTYFPARPRNSWRNTTNRDVVPFEKIYPSSVRSSRITRTGATFYQSDGVCPKCGSHELSPRGFLLTRSAPNRGRPTRMIVSTGHPKPRSKRTGRKVNAFSRTFDVSTVVNPSFPRKKTWEHTVKEVHIPTVAAVQDCRDARSCNRMRQRELTSAREQNRVKSSRYRDTLREYIIAEKSKPVRTAEFNILIMSCNLTT